MTDPRALEILEFWKTAGPSAWWKKNADFDQQISAKFGDLMESAILGELDHWRDDAQSCLALVLILDQFSRNLFRNDAKAFAQDDYALELAMHGIGNGYDNNCDEEISGFFYMPYMHSEDLANQEKCIELFANSSEEASLKSAIEHRDIIKRFGRFPHRNNVLNRQTTDEEQAFLDGGGFSG